MTMRNLRILLVEDNPDDAELTRRAFGMAGVEVELRRVENGEECLRYLRHEGDYADAPDPDLILLDLNMPVMGGREVLSAISEDDRLRHYPVVVLTTSAAEEDIEAMYRLRCSSYLTKPVSFTQFVDAIKQMAGFWLSLARLPRPRRGS